MKALAQFSHFYGGMHPTDIRRLTIAEYTAMHEYMREWMEAQNDGRG